MPPLDLTTPVPVDARVDPTAPGNDYDQAKIIKFEWYPNQDRGSIIAEFGNTVNNDWQRGVGGKRTTTPISNDPFLDSNGDPIPGSEDQYNAMLMAKHEEQPAILALCDAALVWAADGHTMNAAQAAEVQAIRDAVNAMTSTYYDVKVKLYRHLTSNNVYDGTLV